MAARVLLLASIALLLTLCLSIDHGVFAPPWQHLIASLLGASKSERARAAA